MKLCTCFRHLANSEIKQEAVTGSDVAHAVSKAGLRACLDICSYDKAPRRPHRQVVHKLLGKQCWQPAESHWQPLGTGPSRLKSGELHPPGSSQGKARSQVVPPTQRCSTCSAGYSNLLPPPPPPPPQQQGTHVKCSSLTSAGAAPELLPSQSGAPHRGAAGGALFDQPSPPRGTPCSATKWILGQITPWDSAA